MKRRVFNCRKWRKTGDVGDNSQFWELATVIREYDDKEGRRLQDVLFPNDDQVSCGHFVDVIS